MRCGQRLSYGRVAGGACGVGSKWQLTIMCIAKFTRAYADTAGRHEHCLPILTPTSQRPHPGTRHPRRTRHNYDQLVLRHRLVSPHHPILLIDMADW